VADKSEAFLVIKTVIITALLASLLIPKPQPCTLDKEAAKASSDMVNRLTALIGDKDKQLAQAQAQLGETVTQAQRAYRAAEEALVAEKKRVAAKALSCGKGK
jgi:hypothetical protein